MGPKPSPSATWFSAFLTSISRRIKSSFTNSGATNSHSSLTPTSSPASAPIAHHRARPRPGVRRKREPFLVPICDPVADYWGPEPDPYDSSLFKPTHPIRPSEVEIVQSCTPKRALSATNASYPRVDHISATTKPHGQKGGPDQGTLSLYYGATDKQTNHPGKRIPRPGYGSSGLSLGHWYNAARADAGKSIGMWTRHAWDPFRAAPKSNTALTPRATPSPGQGMALPPPRPQQAGRALFQGARRCLGLHQHVWKIGGQTRSPGGGRINHEATVHFSTPATTLAPPANADMGMELLMPLKEKTTTSQSFSRVQETLSTGATIRARPQNAKVRLSSARHLINSKRVMSNPLKFHYAGAGFPKDHAYFKIKSSGFNAVRGMPTSSSSSHWKSFSVGEDAWFARHDALGVADGVGGWNTVAANADPALFSKTLMHLLCSAIEKTDSSSIDGTSHNLDPLGHHLGILDRMNATSVLQYCYTILEQELSLQNVVGSTTVLMTTLRPDGMLSIAHLGDCGLMVIRGGELTFRTEEQQHSFNFPFQLGTDSFDRATDALLYNVPIAAGDIVLLASDGVFDNLWDEEVIALIMEGGKPLDMAERVARKAKDESEARRGRASPFQLRANSVGWAYEGGKVDDLVVVVGKVIDPATLGN